MTLMKYFETLDIKSQIFSVLSEVWTFFIKTPRDFFQRQTVSFPNVSHFCLFRLLSLVSVYLFFLSTVSFLLPLPSLAWLAPVETPQAAATPLVVCVQDPRLTAAETKPKSTEPGPRCLSSGLRKNFCWKQMRCSSLYNYSNTLFKKYFYNVSRYEDSWH